MGEEFWKGDNEALEESLTAEALEEPVAAKALNESFAAKALEESLTAETSEEYGKRIQGYAEITNEFARKKILLLESAPYTLRRTFDARCSS